MAREQGTRDAGLAVINETLTEWGFTGNTLADGSGLSNDNRTTCATLLGVLARSGPEDPLGVGMPVAGVSGTMTDVFVDTDVEGELRAKTGTLGNPPFNADPPAVKSLSGYLPVDEGSTITFALDPQRHRTAQRSERLSPDLERPGRRVWRRIRQAPRPATWPRGSDTVMPTMPMFPLGTVLVPGGGLAVAHLRRALPTDGPGRAGRRWSGRVRGRADHAGDRGRRRRRAGRRGVRGPHPRRRGQPGRSVRAGDRWASSGPGDALAAGRPVPAGRGRGLAR